jgi:hypothetical protein
VQSRAPFTVSAILGPAFGASYDELKRSTGLRSIGGRRQFGDRVVGCARSSTSSNRRCSSARDSAHHSRAKNNRLRKPRRGGVRTRCLTCPADCADGIAIAYTDGPESLTKRHFRLGARCLDLAHRVAAQHRPRMSTPWIGPGVRAKESLPVDVQSFLPSLPYLQLVQTGPDKSLSVRRTDEA